MKGLASLFLFTLYDRYVPSILIGSLVARNSNMLVVFCFEMPIHIALFSCFFFLYNFKLEMIPKLSMICKAQLREFVSVVIRVVSSANGDIFAS